MMSPHTARLRQVQRLTSLASPARSFTTTGCSSIKLVDVASSNSKDHPPKPSSARGNPSSSVLSRLEHANADLQRAHQRYQALNAAAAGPAPPAYVVVPPTGGVYAPRTDELPTLPGYTPAESGEGLREVGREDSWWEDNWGPDNEIPGFAARGVPVEQTHVLQVAVRRAVVEALLLRQSGRAGWEAAQLQIGGADEAHAVLRAELRVAADGEGEVVGSSVDVESILGSDGQLQEGEVFLAPEAAAEVVESWDAAWQEISLADYRLKFAVCKRLYQLTGVRVFDFYLPKITTVRDLLQHIHKAPKPATVAQSLDQKNSVLLELPHVAVYTRRLTPIDKDMKHGRWKVIEKELKERELPVVGHKHLQPQWEGKWITGKRRFLNRRF